MADGTLDILGRRSQVFKTSYSSDDFQLVIGGADNPFMVLNNLAWNYSQNVTRLFDLEDANYQALVASRPQGQMTIADVVTNFEDLITFMQRYGDPCAAETSKNIVVEIKGRDNDQGLCRAQRGSMVFSQPVLVSAALSISVQDYMVNNNMAFIFASARSGGGGSGGRTT